MKKIMYVVLLIISVIGLSACSSEKSISEDLQSVKWNVVATNGENYTAEFGQDTVTFTMPIFSLGMAYEINEDVVELMKEDEIFAYEISKNGDEYKFVAMDSKTKDKFGDLTLSPVK